MPKNQTPSKLKLDQTEDVEYEMRKTVETKEDGRKLIYYNFVRKGESTSAGNSAEESGKEGAN